MRAKLIQIGREHNDVRHTDSLLGRVSILFVTGLKQMIEDLNFGFRQNSCLPSKDVPFPIVILMLSIGMEG